MDGRWEIRVDKTVCQGSGLCAGIAPGHFELDAGHRSGPKTPVVDADPAVLDAAECCPTEAITIIDTDTGEALSGSG